MVEVLDLRKKKLVPEKLPTPPVVVAPVEPPVRHPAFKNDELLTDSGAVLPYPTLRWVAPQLYRRVGTPLPYVIAVLLGIAGILFAIFQRDITTPVLFILLGIMVVVHVRRPLSMLRIEVSPLDIKVDDTTYHYDEIKSFWIHFDPLRNIAELSIRRKKWYQPYLKIQLAGQDPVQVRAILVEFIPEEEHHETLLQTIIRYSGL